MIAFRKDTTFPYLALARRAGVPYATVLQRSDQLRRTQQTEIELIRGASTRTPLLTAIVAVMDAEDVRRCPRQHEAKMLEDVIEGYLACCGEIARTFVEAAGLQTERPEPHQSSAATGDAVHFGNILRDDAARLRARADALDLPAEPQSPQLADVLASCKMEHTEFEKWAASKKYDMHEHPLHYLFMDPKTNAARQGWKAALRYVSSHLTRDEGASLKTGDFYLVPREIIDQFQEINPSNYGHDDACAINAWGCEVVANAKPAPQLSVADPLAVPANGWVHLKAKRVLSVDRGETTVLCDRGIPTELMILVGDEAPAAPIEVKRFDGAKCPSYPACTGGCGLGCAHELEQQNS
ncbi:hypothetical protein ACRQ5Q_15340 [Bradyrhizobium sp. PMVTL-01]|uniref:hypothetical protein n=1 Tax=Bradyrhizobium sp. PMVTL-01 TaxID=3434999 RepID=UPI003F701E91